MKTRTIILLLSGLFLQTPALRAGEATYWLKLSGQRVMYEVTIHSIGDDTLHVLTQTKIVALPLSSVEQIRPLRESALLKDAAAGAAIGIGAGALLGLAVENNGESSAPWVRAGLIGGVLGAVAGSVIGGFEKEGIIVLSGMSNAEKKQALLELIRK